MPDPVPYHCIESELSPPKSTGSTDRPACAYGRYPCTARLNDIAEDVDGAAIGVYSRPEGKGVESNGTRSKGSSGVGIVAEEVVVVVVVLRRFGLFELKSSVGRICRFRGSVVEFGFEADCRPGVDCNCDSDCEALGECTERGEVDLVRDLKPFAGVAG